MVSIYMVRGIYNLSGAVHHKDVGVMVSNYMASIIFYSQMGFPLSSVPTLVIVPSTGAAETSPMMAMRTARMKRLTVLFCMLTYWLDGCFLFLGMGRDVRI